MTAAPARERFFKVRTAETERMNRLVGDLPDAGMSLRGYRGPPFAAPDNIQVAGWSTVLTYAAIAAEAFGENFDFPTPMFESGGSSAGRIRSGV